MKYTELQVTTNFTFLRGGSHPWEYIEQAAGMGYEQIAITDRLTLSGIVRAHAAAREKGIRLIIGCRLDLQDGPSLLAYPVNRSAYANLCSLLTTGNLRAEKGSCLLYKKDVFALQSDFRYIIIPPSGLDASFMIDPSFFSSLREYKQALGRSLYLAASRFYQGNDQKYLARLAELSIAADVPMVAVNDVHYHHPVRRELQDIVTCVREKCTIYNAGFRLQANAERYLKESEEMERLFRQYPDAIHRTGEIAADCTFSLEELKYEYPEEITTDGRTPQEELAMLAWKGAKVCFGENIPVKTAVTIQYELDFIQKMNYAPYFLTVYDIVRFAREKGILCQGRGSAANSTVCYCLGITSVDPTKFDLLFERFISDARNEPPDIDVDFEHERREEVIQYIYEKYGRDRAAIVATVTQQHQRGAFRDVAKAMGLSNDMISRLSGSLWEYTDEWFDKKRISEQGLDPGDEYLQKVLSLTRQFMGFPRQLGQHTGGFVITRTKLSHLCPILHARMENRTCIEWNKDDIDVLGFLKIDVLALGMLTCIRKAFDLAHQHHGLSLTLANIPPDEPEVYDMIGRADTIGVFQIESRAQQSMLPRLKPRNFYDLVIEVAIVRPGPIQGDMVHPYLRRRNGEEPVEFPSKELEAILGRTLGVPLFQEQAMKIAIVAAGFSPAEADQLRRSMATFKAHGMVSHFEEKLIRGMIKNGYSLEYAQRVFRQLEGFGSYGFPESHAASFALLVYVSSWLKCFYPDVFACALLNSLPMGFYQPAQIVIDARRHGVEVRAADINHSYWDNSLEEKKGQYCVLRLGFRQIKGLKEEDMQKLVARRIHPYTSVNSVRDAGIPDAALEKLAEADAFRSIGLDRRQALWETTTRDRPEKIFKGQTAPDAVQENVQLPLMPESEQVVHDYATTSLSVKAHPVSFIRSTLHQLHVVPSHELSRGKNGDRIKVAGLVLVRQRPGTAGGVCFMTIEDEFGFVNLVIFEKLFETYRKPILQSKLILIEGKLQIEGAVIHVIVEKCHDISRLLRQLTQSGTKEWPAIGLSRADEGAISPPDTRTQKNKQEESLFPGARNFQ